MKKWFRLPIGFWVIAIAAIVSINIFLMGSSQASIRTITEAPGQILYQSRDSLRDQAGQPWQVVFFKRVAQDNAPVINLRLVGFPEGTNFVHPAPLPISNGQEQLLAADMFAEANPAPNVGQYDLSNVLEQLPTTSFWELNVPLETPQTATIRIPYFLLQEWQEVVDSE